MNEDGVELRDAVSAGVLGSESDYRALLQSIVEVARSIFNAKASSLMLLDEEADELVFEAVAGEGSQTLIGQRIPSSTGIGGWVLVTRQPLVIEDLRQDPRFDRSTAEKTGYVPEGMMCVPLLHEERALGVLYVLDRPQDSRFTLAEMDLLGLFGNQAAIALQLLQRARRVQGLMEGSTGDDVAAVAQLAEAVDKLDDEKRAAGVQLIRSIEKILR
ncbi:MAG: GAF domain-containing protein [Gaiellaceae bacterium]